DVIQVLLTWQSGTLYFEDGIEPPADRLLIALSPVTLLPPSVVQQPQKDIVQKLGDNTSRELLPPSVVQQPQQVPDPTTKAQISESLFLTETPPGPVTSTPLTYFTRDYAEVQSSTSL